MGSIYKRGRVYWIKFRQAGRVLRESAETTKPNVARRKLKAREGDVANGIRVDPRRDKVTFDEAAKDVVNDFKVNARRSLEVVERRISKHLQPYFGGRRLIDISPSLIADYIVKRQSDSIVVRSAYTLKGADGLPRTIPESRRTIERVSNGEINRELQVLRRIFNLARRNDKCRDVPYVPMLKEEGTRVGFFERDSFEAMLRHLPSDLRAPIRFAYITGWRIPSEVLPLEWRQVDFEAGEIRLDPHTTKNGEGRVFPMTEGLRELLLERQADADRVRRAGHVIPQVFWREVANGRRGPKKPVPITSLLQSFKTACRNAGCPGRIPHDLRRTAVRNLVRAGIPERVAMTMSGHKTRSVFERYNVVGGTDLTDAARKLDFFERPESATTELRTAGRA
jgi:integrase